MKQSAWSTSGFNILASWFSSMDDYNQNDKCNTYVLIMNKVII